MTCPLLRRQVQFLDTVEICPLLRRQVQFSDKVVDMPVGVQRQVHEGAVLGPARHARYCATPSVQSSRRCRRHPCRGADADSLGQFSIVFLQLQYIDKVVDFCCAGPAVLESRCGGDSRAPTVCSLNSGQVVACPLCATTGAGWFGVQKTAVVPQLQCSDMVSGDFLGPCSQKPPSVVVEYIQPTPVVEHVAPAPEVTYAALAPVVEYVRQAENSDIIETNEKRTLRISPADCEGVIEELSKAMEEGFSAVLDEYIENFDRPEGLSAVIDEYFEKFDKPDKKHESDGIRMRYVGLGER